MMSDYIEILNIALFERIKYYKNYVIKIQLSDILYVRAVRY